MWIKCRIVFNKKVFNSQIRLFKCISGQRLQTHILMQNLTFRILMFDNLTPFIKIIGVNFQSVNECCQLCSINVIFWTMKQQKGHKEPLWCNSKRIIQASLSLFYPLLKKNWVYSRHYLKARQSRNRWKEFHCLVGIRGTGKNQMTLNRNIEGGKKQNKSKDRLVSSFNRQNREERQSRMLGRVDRKMSFRGSCRDKSAEKLWTGGSWSEKADSQTEEENNRNGGRLRRTL